MASLFKFSRAVLCAVAVGAAVLLPLSAASVWAAPGDAPASSTRSAPDWSDGRSVPLPDDALRDRRFERLQEDDYRSLSGSGQYQRCLAQVSVDPDDAFDMGLIWRDQGGGAPALHCIALALVALEYYGEAATRLEDLARAPDAGEVPLRVEILGQAGNAWLLEAQGERAIGAFTAGIELAATEADVPVTALRFDRARALALLEDWVAAERDLSAVLEAEPRHLSAFVLRATARRQDGDAGGAAADIAAALRLSPQDPAALIERGAQRAAAGNIDGARSDWVDAAVRGEGTPLADAARDLIARLEVDGTVTPPRQAQTRSRALASAQRPDTPQQTMPQQTMPQRLTPQRPLPTAPRGAPPPRDAAAALAIAQAAAQPLAPAPTPSPSAAQAAPQALAAPAAIVPIPVRRPDHARAPATQDLGIRLRGITDAP